MSEQKVIICKQMDKEVTDFLAAISYDKVFILTDTNTHEQCYPLVKQIAPLREAPVLTLEAGDTHKSLEQIAAVWEALSSGGASRKSLLVNLGGGMVTDLGGFAAATFKRGIRTINIPTTLMGSVDAAVGGKTGFNFHGLKNEIGAFWVPECVFINCEFLRTLDRDNFLSGYAEMMKHALISSIDDYISIFLFDPDAKMDYSFLGKMVERSVAVKERIVAEDPKEEGIRKALNFGHTVGHALESLSFAQNRPVLHGHAVAAGLVAELYLSHKLCGFPMDKLSQVVYYIKNYYRPIPFTCDDYDRLYELMTHDKKNVSGQIRFTLLAQIGDVLFQTGKAELESGGIRNIEKLADFLKQYPAYNVSIEGHTDNVGSVNNNQSLSERRADAVERALVHMNIASNRLETRGYGEEYPVASNATAAARQLNRRVEIILSDSDGNIVQR